VPDQQCRDRPFRQKPVPPALRQSARDQPGKAADLKNHEAGREITPRGATSQAPGCDPPEQVQPENCPDDNEKKAHPRFVTPERSVSASPDTIRREVSLRLPGIAASRHRIVAQRYAPCSVGRAMNISIITKSIVCATAVLLLAAAPVFSKTVQLPNEDFAVASIDFPTSWEPEEINNGVAAESPDKAVFLSAVAVGSDKGMSAELDDTFDFLKEHNVELDKKSKSEGKFKIGDLEAEELTFQGKDEDGPAAVSIAFVTIKDKVVVLTYWVSTDKEKEHQDEVGKILRSLKASSK